MPNIKPLKKDYRSIRGLHTSFPTVYKNLVYYACDSDARFILGLDKIVFDSLSDTEVKELIILTLSYGLETYEDEFKEYILNQYTKTNSIFNSILNHDIDHIKLALNDQKFQNVFKLIFFGDVNMSTRVLTKLKTRFGKMKSDAKPGEGEISVLRSLIRSLLEGRNVAPDGTVIEEAE